VRYIVVTPTYNEAENLPRLAEALAAIDPKPDVLVVDDASPDGTGEIADGIAERDGSFHVLHRTGPRGYAAASRDGLAWALDRDYDYICTMDADLSHDPARLPEMLARAGAGADLVIGSRYIPEGEVVADWSAMRRAVSKGGSSYARTMLGVDVMDCTSGFRCYDRSALEVLPLGSMRSDGYCFLIEILDMVRRADLRIAEVPITYTDRTHGHSKISRSIVFEALWVTTMLGARRVVKPAPAQTRDAKT
jgi:dolichol-phosphate mannosyltransferase